MKSKKLFWYYLSDFRLKIKCHFKQSSRNRKTFFFFSFLCRYYQGIILLLWRLLLRCSKKGKKSLENINCLPICDFFDSALDCNKRIFRFLFILSAYGNEVIEIQEKCGWIIRCQGLCCQAFFDLFAVWLRRCWMELIFVFHFDI